MHIQLEFYLVDNPFLLCHGPPLLLNNETMVFLQNHLSASLQQYQKASQRPDQAMAIITLTGQMVTNN